MKRMFSVVVMVVFLGFIASLKAVPASAGGKNPASAADKKENEQVIMVVLDKITLPDLELYAGPFFKSIMERGSVALMNANNAGTLGTEGGYLTIGAGARFLGNKLVRTAFHKDESYEGYAAQEIYRRHTGRVEPPEGEILHLYPRTLWQLNQNLPYPSLLGMLGESLQAGGHRTAVLGNADTGNEGRQAVAIAMNADGAVTYGDVGTSLLKRDGEAPFGRRSDAGAYLKAFGAVCEKASFLVVEWGDTTRLDAYSGRLPHARRGELLRSSLAELDCFLAGISPHLEGGALLLFVTPSPAGAAFRGGQRLTPLILYHTNLKQGGLLFSATTRRPGIVTNLDLAPTVLKHLGVKPAVFLWGTPLEVFPTEDHLQELAVLSRRTAFLNSQRPGVIKGYLTYQMIVLLAGLIMVLLRFSSVRKLKFAYHALLYFPPAILLAAAFPFFPFPSLLSNALLLIGLTAVLAGLAGLFFPETPSFFAFTGLFIFSLLFIDLLQGAPLSSRSFLGYDPIVGARFYGMGNEYMGILIGSFILGFGSLYSCLPHGFSPLKKGGPQGRLGTTYMFLVTGLFAFLSLLVIFGMASPSYGANLGGALTVGVALAVTWRGFLALWAREGLFFKPTVQGKSAKALWFRLLPLALPATFFFSTVVLLYLLNVTSSGETVSHLGRTWELVRSNGLGELWNVVSRKMEMNMKLLRWSLWSRALALLLALIIILYYYPVGLVRKILRREAWFKVLLGGVAAGSVTAYFANDSGVVAAAMTLFYGALPLLLLALEEVGA